MKITFLLCGGTIEKTYDEILENTRFSEESENIVSTLIRVHIRPKNLDLHFTRVMQKDSLNMDSTDREVVADSCASAHSDTVVIIHGTSTIKKTSEILAADPRLINKTIVLTGAIHPYFLSGTRDSISNISSALTAVQILEKGIYIVMSGEVTPFTQRAPSK